MRSSIDMDKPADIEAWRKGLGNYSDIDIEPGMTNEQVYKRLEEALEAGKLVFETPVRSWLPATRDRLHLQPLPIKESAIFLSGELPDFHRDPFDRLIAAQAMDLGMTVLSPDTPLSKLGASRIW